MNIESNSRRFIYEVLINNYNFIKLPTHYLLDFTSRKPQTIYYAYEAFILHLGKNLSSIKDRIYEIDDDVRVYWKECLLSLLKDHKKLTENYKGTFRNIEYSAELQNTFRANRLDIIKDNIINVVTSFPRQEITLEGCVSNWKSLSNSCVPLINEVYNSHRTMLNQIKKYNINRNNEFQNNLEITCKVGSLAVNLGKVIIPTIAAF